MLCPFADIMLVKANISGPMADIRGFAAHSQVGFGSLFTMFNNPARRASTHFWISQQGGLQQYVPTDRQAWAHGPGNPHFWSSEFEGMSTDALTSEQIDKGGELIAWLHGLSPFTVAINRDGLAGEGLTPHRDLMPTDCPGNLRLSQYPELILATLRHLDGTPSTGDDDMTPEQAQQLKDLHAWMVLQKTSPPLQQDGKIVHAGNLVGTLQTSLKQVADDIVKRVKG